MAPARQGRVFLCWLCIQTVSTKRVCTEELHEVPGVVAYKGKDMYLGNDKESSKEISME